MVICEGGLRANELKRAAQHNYVPMFESSMTGRREGVVIYFTSPKVETAAAMPMKAESLRKKLFSMRQPMMWGTPWKRTSW
mmetsp:Transcript_8210/g.27275  ORF Transcript_8210/g.27275 Transcript_8210/m.27275 type:complete len:81 (+) Transcript_8210:538-780(+)